MAETTEETVTPPVEEVQQTNNAAAKKKAKKKRNKANKKAAAAASANDDVPDETEAPEPPEASSNTGGVAVSDLSEMELYNLMYRRKGGVLEDRPHQFWDTQPVPKMTEMVDESGPLQHQTIEDIRKEPYAMPPGYEWALFDINDDAQANEIYTLLFENYVEDDDCYFRFDYSVQFLRWALCPPGYLPQLHLAVRSVKTKKIYACITGVPASMLVRGNDVPMVEINYLCVHKKLRSKRLAPVLIKEITRRVNLTGVFQAVYTAGVVLPKPVAQCRYWHRSLNPKKLIEVGFSRLSERMTMTRTIRLHKLPDQPQCTGIRPLQIEDCASACELLNNYLARFKLTPHFSLEEFTHFFMPVPDVVDTHVIADASGKVTDLCSFYYLPSSAMRSEKHKTLYAVYSFYNVATTVTMTQLMRDNLIIAKNKGQDVFNALDVMENCDTFQELKFGGGDGNLQYYLYNWKCPGMPSNDVGLVLF